MSPATLPTLPQIGLTSIRQAGVEVLRPAGRLAGCLGRDNASFLIEKLGCRGLDPNQTIVLFATCGVLQKERDL